MELEIELCRLRAFRGQHSESISTHGEDQGNANYVRAIDLLKERFGKQQKIMHAAMQALIKLPAPSSKVSSLRNDYAITASFHTTAKPGKRAQPGLRPSNGGKVPRAVIKCAFCDGGHRSGDCAVYTDADSRLKVVKEKRLCFNCLAKHPVAKCSSSNRCLKCKRKHHTTICSSQAGN